MTIYHPRITTLDDVALRLHAAHRPGHVSEEIYLIDQARLTAELFCTLFEEWGRGGHIRDFSPVGPSVIRVSHHEDRQTGTFALTVSASRRMNSDWWYVKALDVEARGPDAVIKSRKLNTVLQEYFAESFDDGKAVLGNPYYSVYRNAMRHLP